jgi:phospholipid-binding lipoprotein MlaA
MSSLMAPRALRGGIGLLFLLLTACASGPQANAHDPLEPFNRVVFRFNDDLDQAVLKPVASTYNEVLPSPIRTGVRNFFNNLGDAWSFVNSALQLKPRDATDNLLRFGVNTTLGLVGLFDVAGDMGIERHKEDFGQTLGRWGVPAGPYLVLPVLGPSSLRDATALPVDTQGDIVRHVDHVPTRNSAAGLRIVDKRSSLLQAGDLLDSAALDKYTFTRDAWIQYRRNQVYDNDAPDESGSDDQAGSDR